MMEWAVALTVSVVAVVIVAWILLVRHCRRHEEPNGAQPGRVACSQAARRPERMGPGGQER